MTQGIDISRWQGPNFNIAAAKAKGCKYVIARIMTGEVTPGKDSQWDNYYKQAKACGMPIGAYIFGNATTTEAARREATEALSYLSKTQCEFPIFYDVESKAMLTLSKRALTDVIKAFCEAVEAAGYWVGIYSSTAVFNNNMYDTELKRWSHWVADWRGKKPTLKSGNDVQIWQPGSQPNYQPGIEVDQDICYVDYYESQIKARGLNNWTKPEETRPDDTDEELSLALSSIANAVNTIRKILERRKK